MDIKDLTGLGKATNAILNSVSPAVAKLLDMVKARSDFKRFAAFIKEHETSDFKSLKYETPSSKIELEFTSRAPGGDDYINGALSIKGQEIVAQQLNMDKVIVRAANELNSEENVSSESVDEDWLANFFEYAKLASGDYAQILWGKILAGEVKSPGAFSLRTVHTLRLMSKRHAQIFSTLANILLQGDSKYFFFLIDVSYLKSIGIKEEDLIELKELGLIEQKQNFQKPHLLITDKNATFTYYDKKVFLFERAVDMETALSNIHFFTVTKLGMEFLRLVPPAELREGYIEIVKKHFCQKTIDLRKGECSLYMANIIKVSEIEGERTGRAFEHDGLIKI